MYLAVAAAPAEHGPGLELALDPLLGLRVTAVTALGPLRRLRVTR